MYYINVITVRNTANSVSYIFIFSGEAGQLKSLYFIEQTECWLSMTSQIPNITNLIEDNTEEEEDNVEDLVDDHLGR